MKGKRQTTRAKLERERKLQERRALKRERKQTAAAARREGDEGGAAVTEAAADAQFGVVREEAMAAPPSVD